MKAQRKTYIPQGVDSSLETLMMCVGQYETKLLTYVKLIEGKKCIHINKMLENRLVYLY